jgi:hypothetical protein
LRTEAADGHVDDSVGAERRVGDEGNVFAVLEEDEVADRLQGEGPTDEDDCVA